jgi:hypothetical protein
MIWNEHIIARAVARQTLASRCLVLVDRCNWTGHECDILAVTLDQRIIDVEVKISRADLKADAKKDKWWQRRLSQQTARPWPPKVWKHYYAMPADIWDASLLAALPSKNSGVLLFRERRNTGVPVLVECVRRATPNNAADRLTPVQVLDVARLANLRMWDAYQQRDAGIVGYRPQMPARPITERPA